MNSQAIRTNKRAGCLVCLALSLPATLCPVIQAGAQETKLPYLIANPERIARRVFDPQPGGQNVGIYFIRMPGGFMFQRAYAGEGEISRELFRFSILIKVAERQKWMKEAQVRRQQGRNAPMVVERKPLSAFFQDDTLSPGDVVVAIEGFRVFKGSANYPYRATDFVPLERWQRDNGARRGLREMERESRRPQQR